MKEKCKNTADNVYDCEVDFESTDDVFDDDDVKENDNVGKIGKRKMKINQPQDMFDLTDTIKSLLYKYLNYYWKPPKAEELLVCVLDPRTKKIKFSSQIIQEQTFTLLKTKFMEFSQIESQISTPDNSIPKKIKCKRLNKFKIFC